MVDVVEVSPDWWRVDDITLNEFDTSREVDPARRGSIVEHYDTLAEVEQCPGQIVSDEAGTTGDEGSRHRVNLLSAVCAALTLSFTYLVGYLLTGRRVAAIFGVIILGTIDIFWTHAIIAELYAPAAALVSAELLILILWKQKKKSSFSKVCAMLKDS